MEVVAVNGEPSGFLKAYTRDPHAVEVEPTRTDTIESVHEIVCCADQTGTVREKPVESVLKTVSSIEMIASLHEAEATILTVKESFPLTA